jgi:prepilin-type N-terminal cleavage/methylation domain-containing protein
MRRGFTLLEVLVALAISAVIAFAARGYAEALARSSRELAALSGEHHHRMLAERMLRRAILSAGHAQPGHARFDGLPARAIMTTTCPTPAGWLEPCRVELQVRSLRGDDVLVALHDGGAPLELMRGRSISFLFLDSARASSSWKTRWEAGIAMPQAMAILADEDTTIYRLSVRTLR